MLLRISKQYQFSQIGRMKQRKRSHIKYFSKPIIEGQYGVVPARAVPSHIHRPSYLSEIKPVYGIYEGAPVVHNQDMIQKLRKSAQIAAQTAYVAQKSVKQGMTTDDLDKIVHEFIISQNAYPSPIGFMGFPKSVCTSVNEVCCHGIPNLRPLDSGDSLNIDVTIFYDGVHGDTSVMAQVPEMNPEITKLIDTTQKALYEAIKICKPGQKFNKIGDIIEDVAGDEGFTVCELFTGHGIGELMHMPPTIIHNCNFNTGSLDFQKFNTKGNTYFYIKTFKKIQESTILKYVVNDYPGVMVPGNVFTIEPILLMRHDQYLMWKDNFTVVSRDNPSAQWEHMILITENGYEVLTKREDETGI